MDSLLVGMAMLSGVWAGFVEGDPKRPVAVAIGERHMTFMGTDEVTFSSYTLSRKETLEGKARIRTIDVTPIRKVDAAGKNGPPAPSVVGLGTLRLGASELKICIGKLGATERARLDGHGGRCYALRRVEPPAPAPGAEKRSPCVQKCVERNQMRAVSIQKIEADCRKECQSVPW